MKKKDYKIPFNDHWWDYVLDKLIIEPDIDRTPELSGALARVSGLIRCQTGSRLKEGVVAEFHSFAQECRGGKDDIEIWEFTIIRRKKLEHEDDST
jgi:hypothetical protein